MEDQLPRKLAAILYADVADYSRLTGEDEEATHRRLSEYLDLASENKRSWHQDKQLLDRSIPNSWASRAVTSITSRDIGDLLDAKRDPPEIESQIIPHRQR